MTLRANTAYATLLIATIYMAVPVFAHEKTLGIIGDSVATGAVASGDLEATVWSLGKSLVGRGLLSKGSIHRTVNFPENSFSTILASGLGIRQDHVFNVAVNGQRVGTIGAQLDVLLKQAGDFPDYLFVSYTANNACHEDIFKQTVSEFRARYFDSLFSGKDEKSGLRALVQSAAGQKKKQIYLLASLDFTQVLTNQSILEHVVPLHFSTVQCRSFRQGATGLPVLHHLAEGLRKMCPAVLNTDPLSLDPVQVRRRQHLKAIHTAMIQAQKRVVYILQKESAENVRLSFLQSPLTLNFEGRHVANDCFHLSNQGQGYLGLAVWDELYRVLMPNP